MANEHPKQSISPASDADAATPNRKKSRRAVIGHQIDTTRERANTLPHDHPAQMGIERTLEKLNIEYNRASD